MSPTKCLGAFLAVGLLPSAVSVIVKHGPHRSCGVSMTFSDFVKRYARDYEPGTDEYSRRESLFVKRAEDIERHNCGDASISHSWRAGVNNLADWSEEALDGLLGVQPGEKQLPQPMNLIRHTESWHGAGPDHGLPKAISWGNLSTIREPRHQGHCGSCWAVSAVTAMNAHAEIQGKPRGFSIAQILACMPNPRKCGGEGGCRGATAELAFDYAVRMGLTTEEKWPYPYETTSPDQVQLKCPKEMAYDAEIKELVKEDGDQRNLHSVQKPGRYNKDMGLTGWVKLPENKEEPLMRALVENGPVKVSVAPSHGWHMYTEGIMDVTGCDMAKVLKHAVVLYGYGAEGDMLYWQMKNSWGPDWGEDGSIRLQRLANEEQDCAWDDYPEKGSGCVGGPQRVWVCGTCGLLYQASFPKFA